MDAKTMEWMQNNGACGSAQEWLRTQLNWQIAWHNCERGDWMKWLLEKLGLCYGSALEHYDATIRPALDRYKSIHTPAWTQYNAIWAPANVRMVSMHRQALNLDPATQEQDRDDIREPAWAQYEAIVTPAWNQYRAVVLPAAAQFEAAAADAIRVCWVCPELK